MRPSSLVVAGFTIDSFQVWDVNEQLRLLSVPCGGHNRPFAFHFHPSSLSFVHCSHSSTAAVISSTTRLLTDNVDAQCIGVPFHSRITTGVRVLTREGGRTVFATVSEDGQMKVWAMNSHHEGSDEGQNSPTLLRSFNDHPDSIRALAVHRSPEGVFIVTVGSKDHLLAYRLRDAMSGDVESVGCPGEEVKKWKRWSELREMEGKVNSSAALDRMDVRMMAVTAVPAPSPTSSLTVVVGDSAGRVRLYNFEPSSSSSPFSLLSSSALHGHPVISLAASASSVLVSGDTGGAVCVWDISAPSMPVLLARHVLHEAGVNACILSPLPLSSLDHLSTSSSPSAFLLLTGGDDGSIGLLSFTVNPTYVLLSRSQYEGAHDSAIQCLALHADRLLLSSGFDQRLRVWRIQQQRTSQEAGRGASEGRDGEVKAGRDVRGDGFRLCKVAGVRLELAEVCDMDCSADGSVYLSGQGLAVLQLTEQQAVCDQEQQDRSSGCP